MLTVDDISAGLTQLEEIALAEISR